MVLIIQQVVSSLWKFKDCSDECRNTEEHTRTAESCMQSPASSSDCDVGEFKESIDTEVSKTKN
jgi:hypothetical protein